MIKLSKILIIIVIGIAISGCRKPLPTHFEYPKGGGPVYQKAWHEGCESGFSAYGNDYWRSFYHYKADIKLMNSNKLYSRIWWDSFNFCRHYVNRYQMDGFWGGAGFGAGKRENFNQDLRNPKVIQEAGFSMPYWGGADIPGWGGMAWGSDVEGSDWLGREGDMKAQWPWNGE